MGDASTLNAKSGILASASYCSCWPAPCYRTPKSKNHRHELGEILISLGRWINRAVNRSKPSGGATCARGAVQGSRGGRTASSIPNMSAVDHFSDVRQTSRQVRKVPKTDIQDSNHAGEIRAVTRPEIVVVDKAAGLARNRILRIHPPLSAHLVSSIYYSAPDAIAEF